MSWNYRVQLSAIGLEGATHAYTETLEAASAACRAFIVRNGLGARDWTGGHVTDYRGNYTVATVSYNGRVWATDGSEIDERARTN